MKKMRNRSRSNHTKRHAMTFAAAAFLAGGFCSQTLAGITPVQPKAGDPLVGLSAAQLNLFELGKVQYSRILTVEEGRGPLQNKSGCVSCHANPLGGWGTIAVTRFGLLDKGQFVELPGGSLLQSEAIAPECAESIPEGATTSLRVTNSSMAFGLIQSIPDADIAANEDPNDLDADGVSGRVHWVTSFEDARNRRNQQPLHAGRFGWKAQLASVLSFSADASLNEMGLTNRFVMTENAPNGNEEILLICDTVPDPEDGPDRDGKHFIDRVTDFQIFLAQPPQTPKSGMTGEQIFNTIGCATCHIPEWTTSSARSIPEVLRNKTIRPYSDFLLHDMGLLADNVVQGAAGLNETRTPTLWNLRTRDPMLHDGSIGGGTFAERVDLAILVHGNPLSEAFNSVSNYENLSSTEREQVIAFLGSLGKLEFDHEDDFEITIFDYYDFRTCSQAGFISPDSPCAIHDIDQDGDVDGNDLDSFLTVYNGPIEDCNNNGVIDLKDIFLGVLPDSDDDGVADPGACLAACPADLTGDSNVDGADLGLLLAAWDTADANADLNDDGNVDGADLGLLLAAWGACQ